MKKNLLTALVIASVLAFNACKKEEGPQGPAGPAGATGPAGSPGANGATGPVGPVGPTGAAGVDGTKILSGTSDPAAGTGANGDFYFNTSSKTMFGPKANNVWPAGVSLVGAAGATGATGATGQAGTQFLTGSVAPTAAIGAVGDYYFDQSTSTFYGPKAASAPEWVTNVFPIGAAHAAKTFYLTPGLVGVTETLKRVSQLVTVSYPHSGPSDEIQATGVYYNQEDMTRMSSYPGWTDNREMIFESTPGSGVFDVIPQNGAPATWGVSSQNPGGSTSSLFRIGAKFRFTQNFTHPTAEFNLTDEDINRITKDNGAFYNQYIYAKVISGNTTGTVRTVAVGEPMYFYRTKHVAVTNNASGPFRANYTARTEFNLNTIPGLGNKIESYKQDGKVYLKYRYVDAATGTPRFETASGATLGWIDITSNYLNTYVVSGASYGPDGSYVTPIGHTTTANPFNLLPAATLVNGTAPLGQPGTVTIAANQVLTQHSSTPSRVQVTNSGNFVFHWDITSGTNQADASTAVPFGPITLVNPNASSNVVGDSWVAGTYNTSNTSIPYWTARTFADTYYKAPNNLTATIPTSTAVGAPSTAYTPLGTSGTVPVIMYADGQPASYFTGKAVVQLQVFVIPGDIVRAAQAKGINVNDSEALAAFANAQ